MSDICHICGKPGADAIDHKIPLAHGGTEDPSNLAPAHHSVPPYCNAVKGDRPYAPIVRRSKSLAHVEEYAPPGPSPAHPHG